MGDEKYITLDRDKYFKLSTDRDFLDYEPVSVITKTIDTMAQKVAENMDTVLVEACMAVEVDPDALLKTMKRVRAQEAEIERLNHLVPPCKMGDTVYAIRKFNGVPVIRKGKVSAMYYLDDMRLAIVVKGISRGMWGKTIFGSYEEAKTYLEEKENENQG